MGPRLPSRLVRHGVWALLALGACDASSPDVTGDAGAMEAGAADGFVSTLPSYCVDAGAPPSTLECTGLYADLASKQLADGVRPYAPAVALWSDGAAKERWISLPAGATIDTTNPSEWIFPVGTKVWKQFSVGGRRIETRLWQKVRSNYWINAVYAWSSDEAVAARTSGGDIPLGSGTYHIPTNDECEKCHRGRTEHILGFEQVELGLPGATGLTLAQLVAEGRLAPAPAATNLTLGDDGTGAAAPALGWLHANCGITCHNGNSNAIAYGAGMRLRLDPTELDGRSSAGFASLRTTLGVRVNNPNWNGQTRIVPGDPERSLLYHLISHRGVGDQMPPFATRIIDEENVALVGAWIRALPALALPDGGPDAAPDAGEDMGSPADAGADAAEDAASEDARTPADASEPDAAVDTAEPDAAVDTAESDAAVDAAEPDAAAPDAIAEPPDAGAPLDAGEDGADAGEDAPPPVE
jgi:hypothetical protein